MLAPVTLAFWRQGRTSASGSSVGVGGVELGVGNARRLVTVLLPRWRRWAATAACPSKECGWAAKPRPTSLSWNRLGRRMGYWAGLSALPRSPASHRGRNSGIGRIVRGSDGGGGVVGFGAGQGGVQYRVLCLFEGGQGEGYRQVGAVFGAVGSALDSCYVEACPGVL